jgi:hypothetical protein
MEILQLLCSRRCPLVNNPNLNSQLNSSAKSQDNSLPRTTQKTQSLYCRGEFLVPLHSNDRDVDHIENAVYVCCGHCVAVYRVTA